MHKPTNESKSQVFALSSFGVPQNDISEFLNISDDTLRKHYTEELRKAKIERNAEVAAFLFRSANGSTIDSGASYSDCLRAAMFWMKTQGGWRETSKIDLSSEDGSFAPSTVRIEAVAGKSCKG